MMIGAVAMAQSVVNLQGTRSVLDPDWVQRNHETPSDELTAKAESGLARINTILRDVLNNEPTAVAGSAKVCAGSYNDGLCETIGNSRNAVILFSPRSLEDVSETYSPLKKVYLTSWLERVGMLPNSPDKLKSAIGSMDEGQAAALMGLYKECAFCLDADEIYFILKHELSHKKHGDNEKRLAVRLIAAACALVFLNAYSESLNPACFYLLAFLSLFLPQLCSMKSEYSQEFVADACGIHADARAKRGALSYFKKMAIYELAADRYYQLTGKVFNSGAFVMGRICHAAGMGHPSAIERYRSVMSA